jgi:copper chaperone
MNHGKQETGMIELTVKNMSCGHCVSAVTQAAKDVDPGAEVNVDLDKAHVSIRSASPAAGFIAKIGEAGYASLRVVRLWLHDMDHYSFLCEAGRVREGRLGFGMTNAIGIFQISRAPSQPSPAPQGKELNQA